MPPLFRVEERFPIADADQFPESGAPTYSIQANPAYDAVIDLDTRLTPDGLKTIAWRNGSGDSWLLEGPGVEVTITTVPGANHQRSKVILSPMKGVKNQVDWFTASAQQTSGKSEIVLNCASDSWMEDPLPA